MIDDDMKVAVMLKRSPKELRDHLVLESPQLVNVEFKFPVVRELVQHWCQSRRVFFPQKPPYGSRSCQYCCEWFRCDSVCSWLAWKGHGQGKSREKGKVKGKGKSKGKKGKEKVESKARIELLLQQLSKAFDLFSSSFFGTHFSE